MCGIARNLSRRARAAPVVDQAAGGNAQVTVQQGVVAEVELLVHEGGLELGVQVGEQLAAADEEVMAAQVAVGGEFGLVQVFDVAQGFATRAQVMSMLSCFLVRASSSVNRPMGIAILEMQGTGSTVRRHDAVLVKPLTAMS